jgi:hypothetical protein
MLPEARSEPPKLPFVQNAASVKVGSEPTSDNFGQDSAGFSAFKGRSADFAVIGD